MDITRAGCATKALGVAFALAGAAVAARAQPVNDDCSGALPIACGDTASGSTVGATPASLGTCGTTDGSGGAVWYRFTGTGDEVTISTCNPGSNYDTKLRVFEGACGSLVCVAGDDDSPCSFSGLRSQVTWYSQAGVEYYILVHGFSSAEGSYEMSLGCTPPPEPQPNDNCADATVITEGTYSSDTRGNTTDGSSLCSTGAAPDLWYAYTPDTDKMVRLSTCGSSLDTVLSVHTGCPGTTATQISCNDNACGLQSDLIVGVAAGSTYYIRVAGAGSASGPFTLTLSDYDPSQIVGPDVIYADCGSVTNWGAVGGVRGYSLSTLTCNVGDENMTWNGGTGSPWLAMNAYRLEGGRLEQIGMSWLKNACCAAASTACGTCNGVGGQQLGVGCSDAYGSGYNGGQSRLGPRSGVNAYTGAISANDSTSGDAIYKRLQVAESDLDQAVHGGALYFVEGIYVSIDDAPAGNGLNNASYKRVLVSPTGFDLLPTGAMHRTSPAIFAWRDSGNGADTVDDTVDIQTADVPDEGRFYVGSKVIDNGDGTWRYEYAVYNLNSDRSAGSFSVPLPPGAAVTGVGFHDVDYHSGEPYDNTDWSSVVGAAAVTWSSPQTFAQNPNSNALRWGTMYNFWFTADHAPGPGAATVGLFRPGSPGSVDASVSVPGGCPCDLDDAAGVDVFDLLAYLRCWFPASAGDCP